MMSARPPLAAPRQQRPGSSRALRRTREVIDGPLGQAPLLSGG